MPTEPRSRRSRPAKLPLSRAWIVREALALVRSEGLEKVTMRRVAQALDTGPASLYVYVANTAELHMLVLDELLAGVAEPDGDSWQDRLEALLDDYARVLLDHPGLARTALVVRPTGPHAVRLYDRVLGLLLEGGVEPIRAAWGTDLVLQHVTADAAEHSAPTSTDIDAPADDAAEWDALTRALHSADPADHPHVAAHVDALLGGTPAERARWAVRAVIAGIAASPDPRPDASQ